MSFTMRSRLVPAMVAVLVAAGCGEAPPPMRAMRHFWTLFAFQTALLASRDRGVCGRR